MKIYSSYNVLALNPKLSRILSSNIKLSIGPCGEVSIIHLIVEKFGLILIEYLSSRKRSSPIVILFNSLSSASIS